jgi:hypothetical protein
MFSRIVAVALLGSVAEGIIHAVHTKAYRLGKAAYLATEANNYDRHFAHPDSVVGTAIVSLCFVGMFCAIYEILAICILKILEKLNANNGTN